MLTARLRTTSEVAERLGIAAKTLIDLRYKRQGPPFVRIGRSVRYDEAAVERWIQDHTEGATR